MLAGNHESRLLLAVGVINAESSGLLGSAMHHSSFEHQLHRVEMTSRCVMKQLKTLI